MFWCFSCIVDVFDYNNSSQAISNYLVLSLEQRFFNNFRHVFFGVRNYWYLRLS